MVGTTLCLLLSLGCRTTAPIHVWQPAHTLAPPAAKVALSPIAGAPHLSRRIEQALLQQRPAVSADVALFTADQLLESSPIRLASTASLTNDLAAVQAARSAGAELLLQGEILASNLTDAELQENEAAQAAEQNVNMNQLFFTRLRQPAKDKRLSLLLSWRVIDVRTAQTIGAQTVTLDSRQAAREYPDLEMTQSDSASLLIAASARETWKSVAPFVSRQQVRLAVPWLQLGAWRVRRGVRAAKRGNWPLAEQHWQLAADRFWFNASAHHNLAIAMAAREDFAGAKTRLQQATGVFSYRLPRETLFWLDRNHRLYHQAHHLPRPDEGWAFPEPLSPSELAVSEVASVDVEDLPWWTAIPFTKPPHWTWEAWFAQASPF